MSDTARLVLFGLAVTAGAILAALRIISGDAWLALTLGLLAPSPLLDGKRGVPGVPPGSASGPGAGVSALGLEGIDFAWRFSIAAVLTFIAGVIQLLAGVHR